MKIAIITAIICISYTCLFAQNLGIIQKKRIRNAARDSIYEITLPRYKPAWVSEKRDFCDASIFRDDDEVVHHLLKYVHSGDTIVSKQIFLNSMYRYRYYSCAEPNSGIRVLVLKKGKKNFDMLVRDTTEIEKEFLLQKKNARIKRSDIKKTIKVEKLDSVFFAVKYFLPSTDTIYDNLNLAKNIVNFDYRKPSATARIVVIVPKELPGNTKKHRVPAEVIITRWKDIHYNEQEQEQE